MDIAVVDPGAWQYGMHTFTTVVGRKEIDDTQKAIRIISDMSRSDSRQGGKHAWADNRTLVVLSSRM